MNLFHSPWLRQPPERSDRYTSPYTRRRRVWRRAGLAAHCPSSAGAPALDVDGDATSQATQRRGGCSR
jgi:hypothetical protein